MSTVVVLPSVLGVRSGVLDAVGRLHAAGHHVHVVDVLDGETHDAYEPAMAIWESVGPQELRSRALTLAARLPDEFSCVAFSAGGELAVHLALHRPVPKLVLQAASVSVRWFPEANGWPTRTAVQQHDAVRDPFGDEGTEQLATDVRTSGAQLESYRYDLTAHLFTDPSLPQEYDPAATKLLWKRTLNFLSAPR